QMARQSCPKLEVTGHQFYWVFISHKSHTDTNIFRVPVNTTVVLDVTSADVFHDFGIIKFKIKTDAIQGRTNTICFIPYQVENYTIQCFELCGSGHVGMIAELDVMSVSDFQLWYSAAKLPFVYI